MALVRGAPPYLLRCCLVVVFVALLSVLSGCFASRAPQLSASYTRAENVHVKPTSTFYGFPENLWQKTSTWSFPDKIEADLQSWRDKNPSFAFNVLDDEQSEHFVRQRYRLHPEIVDMYVSLRIPIVKADLFRYLVLYSEGGVWSDLDVACEQGVRKWIPTEYLDRANLVVGIEGLQEYKGPRVALGSQFASWTVMAKPGSEHLLYVIESVRERLASIAKLNGVDWRDLELGMLSDVVDDSGPYKMTRGIVESLYQVSAAPCVLILLIWAANWP